MIQQQCEFCGALFCPNEKPGRHRRQCGKPQCKRALKKLWAREYKERAQKEREIFWKQRGPAKCVVCRTLIQNQARRNRKFCGAICSKNSETISRLETKLKWISAPDFIPTIRARLESKIQELRQPPFGSGAQKKTAGKSDLLSGTEN